MYPTLSAYLVTAGMICLSIQVHAQEPPKRIEGEKLLPVIQEMPEGLPELAMKKQAAVFSCNLTLPTGDSMMNKGFFIDGNGLALCSLVFLCTDAPLRFDASDGQILAAPKVWAVFAKQQLALVKFAYKPKAWLDVSDNRAVAGEWISLISTLRDPAPLTVPVLAWRDVSEANAFPPTFTELSFATGQSPTLDRVFANGAPLMDITGKAVAAFAGFEPLRGQILRYARPLDGLTTAIKTALGKPLDLPIPIPRKHHPYDPVQLDPLWGILHQKRTAIYSADFLSRLQTLLAKYPRHRTLQIIEWEAMWQSVTQGSPGDSILEAARRTEPPENAPAFERAAYFFRLGRAHCAPPGNQEATMDAYRKAFDLAPQTLHLAGAILAGMHLGRGELKDAERLYRKVISIVPERIDYIEGLQKVLTEKGDWQGAADLTPWIYRRVKITSGTRSSLRVSSHCFGKSPHGLILWVFSETMAGGAEPGPFHL